MPYIPEYDRKILFDRKAMKPGELNYLLTRECDDYITRKGLSYNNLNEVMGVLACVQAELYRRVAAPYEDKKCRENGEVYFNA